MYPVSQTFFEQTKLDTQVVYLRGTIDDRVSFTEDNVDRNSYSITCQSTDVTRVRIGTAFSKTLKLLIYEGVGITRGNWQNKKITIDQGQKVNGAIEWVPMGTFFVAKASWSPKGISITAYDCMQNFDVPLDFDQTSGTPYDLLLTTCQTCNVELGQTREQILALPNGDAVLGVQDPTNCPTYRDYIAFLAAVLGGFAEIYRDGKLYIRTYKQTSNDSVSEIERFKNPSFSDFTSYFTQLSITHDGEEYLYTGENAREGGLTMELGANPFLQLGDEYTLNEHAQAIADAIVSIDYTPFSTTVLSSPYYDLGDVITFTGGIAEGCLSCIMAITYHFGNVQLTGYGENPALQKARSAYDKGISSASKSTAQVITYHTFVNSTPIEVNTTWTQLGQLVFSTNRQTMTEAWHEMIFDLSQNDKIELMYYLDGSPITYSPRTKFDSSGEHLMETQMWMNVSSGSVHIWQVYARTTSGTAHIDAGDVHILLKGQGLAASEGWDGILMLEDEITLGVTLDNILPMTDSCDITLRGPELIGLNETLALGITLNNIPTLTDNIDLTATPVRFKLKTEDGLYLAQEGHGKLKTEGITRP